MNHNHYFPVNSSKSVKIHNVTATTSENTRTHTSSLAQTASICQSPDSLRLQTRITRTKKKKKPAMFVACTNSGVQPTAILPSWKLVPLWTTVKCLQYVFTLRPGLCSFSVSCPTARSAVMYHCQRLDDVSRKRMLPTSCHSIRPKTEVCGKTRWSVVARHLSHSVHRSFNGNEDGRWEKEKRNVCKFVRLRNTSCFFVMARTAVSHILQVQYLGYKFGWRSLCGHDGKTHLRNSWVTYVIWPFL